MYKRQRSNSPDYPPDYNATAYIPAIRRYLNINKYYRHPYRVYELPTYRRSNTPENLTFVGMFETRLEAERRLSQTNGGMLFFYGQPIY